MRGWTNPRGVIVQASTELRGVLSTIVSVRQQVELVPPDYPFPVAPVASVQRKPRRPGRSAQ